MKENRTLILISNKVLLNLLTLKYQPMVDEALEEMKQVKRELLLPRPIPGIFNEKESTYQGVLGERAGIGDNT
jgi:hypothetical protein